MEEVFSKIGGTSMIECKFKIYNIDYNEESVVFRLYQILLTPLFSLIRKEIMRKATQKEIETIQEIFSINYVKVLFKQFLEEGLLTKREYELLIKKLDEDINKVLDKGGLMWKKEKQQAFIFMYQPKIKLVKVLV